MSGESGGVIIGAGLAIAAVPVIVGGLAIVGAVRGAAAIAGAIHEIRVDEAASRTEALGRDVFSLAQSNRVTFHNFIKDSQAKFYGSLNSLGAELLNGGKYKTCREGMLEGRKEFVDGVISEGNRLTERIQVELLQKLDAYERETKEKCDLIRANIDSYKRDKEQNKEVAKACAEEMILFATEHIDNVKDVFLKNNIAPTEIVKAENLVNRAKENVLNGDYEAALTNTVNAIDGAEEYLRNNVKESAQKQMYYTMYESTLEELKAMLGATQQIYYIEEADESIVVDYSDLGFEHIKKEVEGKFEALSGKSADDYALYELENLFLDINRSYEEVLKLALDKETEAMNNYFRGNYTKVIKDVMEQRKFKLEEEKDRELNFQNKEGDKIRIIIKPEDISKEDFRTNIRILSHKEDINNNDVEDIEEERKELREAIKKEIESRYSKISMSMTCDSGYGKNAKITETAEEPGTTATDTKRKTYDPSVRREQIKHKKRN